MRISRRDWLLGMGAAALLSKKLARGGELQQLEWGKYFPILNASTNQLPGVPFRLSTAILRLGLKNRYRGRVTFRSSAPDAVLPPPYTFSESDDLYESHQFDVKFMSEGRHTVSVRTDDGSEFESNVILVSKREPKYKLLFGDIHIHSSWSIDGRGSPDYNYIYARDAMQLDFACLTEHDPTDDIWEKIKEKARELYEPGRFVTMSAYEWTAHSLHEGHKNVYYKDFEGPVFRSPWVWNLKERRTLTPDELKALGPSQTWSARDLWGKLRQFGRPAMTIPHHPASAVYPVPWDHYDPEFQRCVEIYSSWGSSENPESPRQIINTDYIRGAGVGHFVKDALAAGQRLGFVGASDSHSGRPGYPAHWKKYAENDYSTWDSDAYSGGITGLYVEESSREAVFDALRNRRCYATTGRRIVLNFKANDHWMGEEIESKDAPHFAIEVIGTGPIDVVTLVKNGVDHIQWPAGQREFKMEYGKTETPRDVDYYYVRVVQKDGEMAWSSPIWISHRSHR
ncbi:MAG: DUF3604 domain-containing protein [Acidobacteriota bacterium]